MALGERWPHLDRAEIEDFARSWLRELETCSGGGSVGESVVMMGFMAPPEQQWAFIIAAVEMATNDEQLAHIAAGPFECLMSRHGEGRTTPTPIEMPPPMTKPRPGGRLRSSRAVSAGSG